MTAQLNCDHLWYIHAVTLCHLANFLACSMAVISLWCFSLSSSSSLTIPLLLSCSLSKWSCTVASDSLHACIHVCMYNSMLDTAGNACSLYCRQWLPACMHTCMYNSMLDTAGNVACTVASDYYDCIIIACLNRLLEIIIASMHVQLIPSRIHCGSLLLCIVNLFETAWEQCPQ